MTKHDMQVLSNFERSIRLTVNDALTSVFLNECSMLDDKPIPCKNRTLQLILAKLQPTNFVEKACIIELVNEHYRKIQL